MILARGVLGDWSQHLFSHFRRGLCLLQESPQFLVTAMGYRGLQSHSATPESCELGRRLPVLLRQGLQIPDFAGLSQQLHLASCQEEGPRRRAPESGKAPAGGSRLTAGSQESIAGNKMKLGERGEESRGHELLHKEITGFESAGGVHK